MKKPIYILLIICILLTLISCNKNDSISSSVSEFISSIDSIQKTPTNISPTSIKDFTFEEVDDSITITKYIGSDNNVVIPETINNKPVTHIGPNSFYKNKEILSVILPNTITSIGQHAFRFCESLTSITLPKNLEEIGSSAFENCQKLTDIILPKSIKNIYSKAFLNCTELM